MTQSKVRSNVSYWHEFADGSDIKTRCYLNGYPIQSHLNYSKEISDDTEIEVHVIKSAVDSVLDTPIGGIPTMKTTDKKEFIMTMKQYTELVVKFWENGHEYYDMI